MEDFKNKFIESLLGYAVQRNISISRLCLDSAIKYNELNKTIPAFIDNNQIENLLKNSVRLSGDPLFGLHFGSSLQLAALGIVGQIIQTSSTVGESLSHGSGLIHLISNLFKVETSTTVETFTINLFVEESSIINFPNSYRQLGDFLLIFLLHEIDGLVLEKIKPLKVSFPYTIENLDSYKQTFRCDFLTTSKNYSITLSNSILSLPIISSNYDLQNYLLEKIEHLIVKNDKSFWHGKIYHYLICNSYLNNLSLENVASNFNMSSRSLQRKLKEEGYSFYSILESVKKSLAITYLGTVDKPLKDISFVLGYNEPSAFNKAFKRWTGVTPMHYKNSLNMMA